MAGTTISPEVEQSIIALNANELTDRLIAKRLSISHKTVATYRKKHGLTPNGQARRPLKIVGGGSAECSRCHVVKPLEGWPVAREGKSSPYRLSYCRDCRRVQMTEAQNKSERRNLRVRWCRVRMRCKKLGIKLGIIYLTPSAKKGSYLLPTEGSDYEPFHHFHLPDFPALPG